MDFSTLPVRRLEEHPLAPMPRGAWPATLPPVRQVLDDGFDLDPVSFHERSHGESFIDIVLSRSRVRGLWLLDEPESALSLPACLALTGVLRDVVAAGSQVVMSTHSPILAAFPGAVVHEVGEWGIRRCPWEDLDLVRNWRAFLDAPDRYLRHLG